MLHGSREVNKERLPFRVEESSNAPDLEVIVRHRGSEKRFQPKEIVALFLQKIKESAEAYLGETIWCAVISVPSAHNDRYRQAIVDAGTIAGLRVNRVVSAPVLAGISNALDKRSRDEEYRALIFDLGNTLKISVMQIEDGIFENLSQDEVEDVGG